MKRSKGVFFITAGIFLLIISGFATGQDQSGAAEIVEPYNRVIMSKDLTDFYDSLYQVNSSNFQIDPEAQYLLSGTVSTVTIIDPSEENYYVEVEIIQANRTPDNRLERFDGIIAVFNPRFMSQIPQRPPQNPGKELIVPNQKGLFLVQYYGPYEVGGGVLIPVFILLEYKGL